MRKIPGRRRRSRTPLKPSMGFTSFRASAPTTAGTPRPRATTAAWEVRPPRAVRIPYVEVLGESGKEVLPSWAGCGA
jgi:hypothetical protein